MNWSQDLPNGLALCAVEGAAHARAAGLEVVLAGGDGLAEDDLFPFLEEELGVPALLVVLEEDLAQDVQGRSPTCCATWATRTRPPATR